MQEKLPGMLVTDGCIYVSANIKEPGVILQHGKILRIFFGVRQKEEKCQLLEQIQKDFRDSAIDGILSEQIQRELLEKFSYVSPIGAAGLYLNATAGDFQKEGKARELFCTMIREIVALAMAMGFPFEKDMVSVNLQILSNLPPEATTSMQRDVMAHRSVGSGWSGIRSGAAWRTDIRFRCPHMKKWHRNCKEKLCAKKILTQKEMWR